MFIQDLANLMLLKSVKINISNNERQTTPRFYNKDRKTPNMLIIMDLPFRSCSIGMLLTYAVCGTILNILVKFSDWIKCKKTRV